MKEKKVIIKAFGYNEYGLVDFPWKFSNVQISRLKYGNEMGCSWCFPHGYETINATCSKNTRSWKKNRKTQYRMRE